MKTIFVSHGGGPLPLLNDPSHEDMVKTLKEMTGEIESPDCILVVSAHWEEDVPTITSHKESTLFYDYYGFPEEAYKIEYPCQGSPNVAKQIFNELKAKGFDPAFDYERGLDHGVFVPLKIMYPDADIPVIQLSLVKGLDPLLHIKMGEAISNLNMEKLLVIGSGFTFHNMRAFFSGGGEAWNIEFEEWLKKVITFDGKENDRKNELINWRKAPSASFCHPREEHLIPIHFCYGITGRKASSYRSISILNKQAGMIIW